MMDTKKKMKRSKFSSEESQSSSMSSSMSSSSSDDEIDAKDLKPIKEYLSNRKELASQLFKSVKTEKIRMMLPQILKKVELSDLEELCANELIGMSKARIMSILNGQEMLQSSDTEDSDDSGPSLEIISDTEWLSDEKTSIKIEGAKSKKNSKRSRKQDTKSKEKSKEKIKAGKDGKSNVKVKLEIKTEAKEKAKGKEKEEEKEGESLLDLLELEMRARAIKALLRKEDDPSCTNSKSDSSKNQASGSGIVSNSSVQARQANLKEQLEKIDVLMKHGDDEDVYVVINPAPTIELLSSDDENHHQYTKLTENPEPEASKEVEKEQQSTSIEKDKDNRDKIQEKGKETVLEKILNIEKDTTKSPEVSGKKGKDTRGKDRSKENGNSNLPMSVIECNSDEKVESPKELVNEEELEEGEIVDNEDDEKEEKKEIKPVVESPSKEKIKKFKKNPNIRSKKRTKESDSDSDSKTMEKKKTETEVTKEKALNEPIEIEDSPERKDADESAPRSRKNSSASSKLDYYDDKALDIEEIINLDDYPDDMDELEKPKEPEPESKQPEETISKSETWASRYVRQDEVQNVIKESKIQSEIRKRLRERQRQSKLSSSPKEQESPTPEPDVIPKPTGSVEEYLALKKLNDGDSSLTADDSSSQDKTEVPIETPAVIVKKPQLIVPTKDKEQQSADKSPVDEQQSIEANVTEEQNTAEEKVIKEQRSPEKNIVIKEDLPLKDKRIIIVKPKENPLPPKDDPNSDSSDDNVTVKIDNSSWAEQQASELRPD